MAFNHIIAAFLGVVSIANGNNLQDVPPSPQATEVEAVEVTGSRQTIERQAEQFVQAVSTAPENATLARWGGRVCVGVANLNSPYGRLVVDRVSAVALDLGLSVGEPGCQPNLMIMFASDADDVARELVSHDRAGFLPNLANSNLGEKRLADFQTSARPVRWWHVSGAVELDTGAPIASSMSGDSVAPVVNVRQMSLLKTGIRQDLQRVIILVDANRTHPANLASIADYVAFVAMAQVDPDVDVGDKPSILTLFSAAPTADSLTSWDMAYLRSLYSAAPDRRVPRQQGREITRRMVDDLLNPDRPQ